MSVNITDTCLVTIGKGCSSMIDKLTIIFDNKLLIGEMRHNIISFLQWIRVWVGYDNPNSSHRVTDANSCLLRNVSRDTLCDWTKMTSNMAAATDADDAMSWRKIAIDLGQIHLSWILTATWLNQTHGPFYGNPPVTNEFPSQRASNVDRWCFFDVSQNTMLNKHPIYRWSETLWRWCDITVMDLPCSSPSRLLANRQLCEITTWATPGYSVCVCKLWESSLLFKDNAISIKTQK